MGSFIVGAKLLGIQIIWRMREFQHCAHSPEVFASALLPLHKIVRAANATSFRKDARFRAKFTGAQKVACTAQTHILSTLLVVTWQELELDISELLSQPTSLHWIRIEPIRTPSNLLQYANQTFG